MSDAITRLNTALEGRYRIERQLGEGGMATVYLADDLRHERKVALKVLKPELAAVVGADRFLAEIKTTANLQHPHILPLFDSGEADSFLFYVMPYVEGESLRQKLDREHQLPVDQAVQIAKDVAEALDYAHAHGVIHRDVKPANILLHAGRPVVSDFGIALAVGIAGGGRLTETGLSLGTPHYMSPEQATGDQTVGIATDVYALACVLYEMLVGEPPYTGSTAQAILGKIIQAEPSSVTDTRRSVPANVDAAIRRALEKLPADRFGSAKEFARALADSGFRHSEQPASVEAVHGDRWKPVAITLAALAVAFATGFGWLLFQPTIPEPATRLTLSTDGWNGVYDAFGRYTALAPDGSSMILHVGEQLALKTRGSTEITPIPGTEGGRDVVYSPDGQWILYSVGSDLFKRPIVGGSPVRLAEDLPPTAGVVGLDWLDDGTIIYEQYLPNAEGSTRRIAQIPEDGGEPEVVFGTDEELAIVWARGLPGGRGALVVACPGTTCPGASTQLHIVDLERHTSEVAFEQALRAWYSRTGHLVYVRNDGAVLAQPFDLGALEVTNAAVPLFDGVRVTVGTTSDYPDMVLGADGTLLYAQGTFGEAAGLQQLVTVDLTGNERVLPLAPRQITWVSGWSPDGESVVYDSQGHIYTYNVRLGTTPRQISFEGVNRMGVFSPDGTRLAFASQRSGTDGDDIFVKALDDDSPPRVVIRGVSLQLPTQWLADSILLFEQYGSLSVDLWIGDPTVQEPAEGRPYLSAEAALYDLTVSPDGRLAAYRSNETGVNEVYVRRFPDPGTQTLVSQSGGVVPYWSPDGNTLYYSRGDGGNTATFFAARLQREPVPAVLGVDSLFTIGPILQPFSGTPLHPDGDRWILARTGPSPVATERASDPPRLVLVQDFFSELE